jgi:hypothetical protein
MRSRITGEMEIKYLGEGFLLSHKLRSREMFPERLLGLLCHPREK